MECSLKTRRSGQLTPHAWIGWLWPVLPLACHVGFSWIGFNPTDDGWLQAVARRIAGGEVPHRDFIFVRPALCAVLQLPLVWLGGDYTIWLSRLWGWMTLGATCWIWSKFAFGSERPYFRGAAYAIAFFLCAHTFPVMAWHTLDGMLLSTLAVMLVARGNSAGWRWGFLLAGMAAMCRQNFALFAPALLLASGPRWRDWPTAALWNVLPLLAYVLTMLVLGGAADFVHQVTILKGELLEVAVFRYIQNAFFAPGIVLGILVALVMNSTGRAGWFARLTAPAGILVVVSWLAISLWRGPLSYQSASFGLAGGVLGFALVMWSRGMTETDRLVLGSGLALAWITSMSLGYHTPALASGILFILLCRLAYMVGVFHCNAGNYLRWSLPIALLAAAGALRYARQTFPYRDWPIHELGWNVSDVLNGGAGLRTNKLTYDIMADLRQLTSQLAAGGRHYAVLTEFSAIWIRSAEHNPLPCEWPHPTEFGYHPLFFQRILTSMDALPSGSRIILQKYAVAHFPVELAPVRLESSYYAVQKWVRNRWQKVDETMFFEIYASPGISDGAGSAILSGRL